MNTSSLSGFQEFETDWIAATDTLARRQLALGEAIRVYRQHSPACRTSRVAQALANQQEAREAVESLMRTIWNKLI